MMNGNLILFENRMHREYFLHALCSNYMRKIGKGRASIIGDTSDVYIHVARVYSSSNPKQKAIYYEFNMCKNDISSKNRNISPFKKRLSYYAIHR